MPALAAPPAGPTAAELSLAAIRQQTIRVSTEKVEALFRQAQEMLAVKLTTAQRCDDVGNVNDDPAQPRGFDHGGPFSEDSIEIPIFGPCPR